MVKEKKIKDKEVVVYSVRTDLALEAKEIYSENNPGKLSGVESDEYIDNNVRVTAVKILDENGGKP